MIGRIKGLIIEKKAPDIIIDVNGVGYELQIPLNAFYQLPDVGKEVILHTHLVVREDSHSLFGFATKEERDLFRTLLKVSGVGPKLALTILSGGNIGTLVRCILEDDTSNLIKLPGIGKKTAQRLLLEMKDKIKDLRLSSTSYTTDTSPAMHDAVSALIALGYKREEVQQILAKYKQDNLASEQLIKLALKDIAGK